MSPRAVTPSTVVIFDGIKRFEDLALELEIFLVSHTDELCLELVTKRHEVEARLYLDMKFLISKIDLNVMNTIFQQKRQQAVEQNVFFHSGREMKALAIELVVQSVISRVEILQVINDFNNTTEFDIFLQPTETDITYDCLDPISYNLHSKLDFQYNEKPPSVIPFNIVRHRIRNLRFVYLFIIYPLFVHFYFILSLPPLF